MLHYPACSSSLEQQPWLRLLLVLHHTSKQVAGQ
jgi:hypothetical protein